MEGDRSRPFCAEVIFRQMWRSWAPPVVAVALLVCHGYATRPPAVQSVCNRLQFFFQRPLAPAAASTVPKGYHLTFDDEFKDLSLSDEDGTGTRWYTQSVQCCMQDTDHKSSPTHMARLHAPEGQNPFALVPGGGLRIRLQKTDGSWYSGVIATADQRGRGFAQQYGYFEMRASFPGHKGTWPAFWLLNSAARLKHEPAGEIDVVESYMQFPEAVNTTLLDWSRKDNLLAHRTSKTPDLSQGFHTFGMLWTAETMTFYCDGSEMMAVPTPAIMHQPYFPIVDLGLGGGWPTAETPDQSDMIIQYVRVYAP